MKLTYALSMLFLGACGCELLAVPVHGDLFSVINNAGETICISYKRTAQGPLLGKLLEPGEALAFGVIAEALLSGVGYTNPAPLRLFPTEQSVPSNQSIAIVEGVKGRGITKPFGDWNVHYVVNKTPEQIFPAIIFPKKSMLIDAFPTAVRKAVPTARFVLGLPHDAKLADAIEATEMLSHKWLSYKTARAEEAQIITDIVRILSNARHAFEAGNPDELLPDLVTPNSLTVALAD